MKRQYECLFIIANNVTEEKRNELINKFAKMASGETKVEKSHPWGMRKFATPIDYKKDGFYVLMNFASTPDVPKKIGDLMNITDGIVRFMFVCKEENTRQAKRMAKKKPRKQPTQTTTEEAAQ